MLKPIASRLTSVTSTGAVFKRNVSVIIGPATKQIAPAEKYALAGTMICCFVATPVYILSNLKNYKGKKE
ncbi:hypothetical protein HA402_006518 [Bradysia odoriphaga]|nr:hypothetical protein HA402_006518 [Bradysia odoriphaga]